MSFATAFAVVWGGLALYLIYLHRRQEVLSREVERLERQRRG